MGAFICQLSEMDWLISREIGVYGNREGSERDGKTKYFAESKKGDQIIQSIIEDLIGMRKRDFVFFHVLKGNKESTLHGVYRVREVPFYNDKVKIWKSSSRLVYPYRFCFEPHPEHIELCKYDAHIPVSEFYRSVENRNIISVLTLEREVRGAAHAVKKIAYDDKNELIKLLYRSYTVSHSDKVVSFSPMKMAMTPLRKLINKIGKIEFALKALVAYELGQKNPRITKYFPPCKEPDFDFVIETFVGQTMRRPTDLMCIAGKDNKTITTIEAKTDQADIEDFIQSLQYQEIFKLRNIEKGSLNYNFSICLLARRFSSKIVEYAFVRNRFLPWEKLILLKYDATQDGKDATFALQNLPSNLPSIMANYPIIKDKDPLDQIKSNVASFYRIFGKVEVDNVDLSIKSSGTDYVLLNKTYKSAKADIGHVMIYQIRGKCTDEKFAKFMKRIRDEANNSFLADFMNVEPFIIAEEYQNTVNLFISSYNEFETKAQRVPIKAYLKL